MNLVSDPLWAFLGTKDMRTLSLVNQQGALQVRTKLSDCKKPGACARSNKKKLTGKCKQYCKRLRNKAEVFRSCLSALRGEELKSNSRMLITMADGGQMAIDFSTETASHVTTADVDLLRHPIYLAAKTKHIEDLIQAIEGSHRNIQSIKIAVSSMTTEEAMFELVSRTTKQWKARAKQVEDAARFLKNLFSSVPNVTVMIGQNSVAALK